MHTRSPHPVSIGSLLAQDTPPATGFVFTGTGGEYFRIWMVNILLSIVTFGIYSAWAKVRRLRYFYGNTLLDGHSFDYHANPLRILIGRIIVVGFLFLMNMLTQANPLFALLIIPYLVALPWIINQSMAFNAQMTSYRNIRFSFQGGYFPALGIFIFMPVVSFASLFLLAPVTASLRSEYIGNGLSFGTSPFHTRPRLGPFYANLAVTALFALLAAAVLFVIAHLVLGIVSPQVSEEEGPASQILSGMIAFYATVIVTFHIYKVGVRNIAFNATVLEGGHRLSSTLSRPRYAWIMFSNLVLTLLTLGLFWPWAAVRSWRYLADSTVFHPARTLDDFVDRTRPRGSGVTAAEYADLGTLDFGL